MDRNSATFSCYSKASTISCKHRQIPLVRPPLTLPAGMTLPIPYLQQQLRTQCGLIPWVFVYAIPILRLRSSEDSKVLFFFSPSTLPWTVFNIQQVINSLLNSEIQFFFKMFTRQLFALLVTLVPRTTRWHTVGA